MKLIIFLILSFNVFAQSPLLTLFDGGYKNPETTLYLTSQTVTGTQATRIDNLVSSLKDSLGITALSTKFDVFYVLANETEALAVRNLIKRSSDATTSGSPTFTQWEGYLGATNKYLNLNFNPKTQGSAYTLNAASIGIYSRDEVAAATKAVYGGRAGGYENQVVLRNTVDLVNGSINTANTPVGTGSTSSQGMYIINRSSASAVEMYRNNVAFVVGGTKTADADLSNCNMYALCWNSNGTAGAFAVDYELAVVFAGTSLSATDVRKITNCIEVYMDAIGKGVIP